MARYDDDGGASDERWLEGQPTVTDHRHLEEPGGVAPRRNASAIVLLIVVLLLVAGAAIFAAVHYLPMAEELSRLRSDAGEARQRGQASEAEMESARAELARLREQHAAVRSERDALRSTAAETEATLDALRRQFDVEIQAGDILVRTADGEVALDMASRILFRSGDADLSDRGKALLRRVADTLRSVETRVIHVAGHTDSKRISRTLQESFPTNWELSTARATNVVRFLQDECNIPGERLAATGYAHYRPVATNRTERGRRLNRRIEIKLSARPMAPAGH